MAHLLGDDKFSYQLDSCMSTRFWFNKELNYKLAASEDFLPNRNAFAFVASLNIYCTSRNFALYYFAYWYLLDTKDQLSGSCITKSNHVIIKLFSLPKAFI